MTCLTHNLPYIIFSSLIISTFFNKPLSLANLLSCNSNSTDMVFCWYSKAMINKVWVYYGRVIHYTKYKLGTCSSVAWRALTSLWRMDGGTEGWIDGGTDGETDGWIDGPRPYPISMGQCKKDVTPLLTHWSYVFLALTRLYGQKCASGKMFVTGVPQPYKFEIMQYVYRISHNIWVRSRNCGCLVTWFCYQLIAKPGNKTAADLWPDPNIGFIEVGSLKLVSLPDTDRLLSSEP